MKKKIGRLIFMLATFFLATENVLGENKYTLLTEVTDENGQKIYRNYNGTSDRQLSIEIKGYDTRNSVVGYCIDVGLELGDKAYIGELDEDLTGYLTGILNNATTASTVSNKINNYIRFGYQYNGQDSYKYLIATQKLIWDELYNAGYRQDHYSSDVYFTAGDNTIDISAEETQIKNNISNYNKTPSMCSSTTKLEIAVGETATYTDSSNVLSNYNVNCSEGLTCKIEGNTLKITATAEGSEQKVTFNKEGIPGNDNIVYQRSGEQAVVINSTPIEGISCEFGIDTYKNVQTSGAKAVAVVSLGMLSIIIAYIIITNNKYLNAK